MNIFISSLSFNVQDDDLKAFFEPYGAVASVKVAYDRETGRSRGFGFVEMPDDAAATAAIAALNGKMIDGRALSVVEARPKESKASRDFNPFRRSGKANKNRGFNKNRF